MTLRVISVELDFIYLLS